MCFSQGRQGSAGDFEKSQRNELGLRETESQRKSLRKKRERAR